MIRPGYVDALEHILTVRAKALDALDALRGVPIYAMALQRFAATPEVVMAAALWQIEPTAVAGQAVQLHRLRTRIAAFEVAAR
jgi:hypothetical protein